MCGINGIIQSKSNAESFDVHSKISVMNNLIKHRGPDDDGVYIYENRIALGMRRLAIIDLRSGKQPIISDDENKVIIFNGEIYNFLELRKNLESLGVTFKTKSDTEVILKMYENFGTNFINKLNGMFAFAILDIKKSSLLLARDRFGQKPLYYFHKNGLFCWASELKSLTAAYPFTPRISIQGLNSYFSMGCIPSPLTIYEDFYKLPPGHLFIINTEDATYTSHKYWGLEKTIGTSADTYKNALNNVRELLYDSVKIRMISDVPLGAFLSGGIDSGIVTAIMSSHSKIPVKTFSIGSRNKNFDESYKASAVSKHLETEHYSFILDEDDILENIDDIILNFDEPFADSSALPTWFVSRMARQYVTVALTGDGGDEVFGGYNRYLIHYYAKNYFRVIPKEVHEKFILPFLAWFPKRQDNRVNLLSKLKKAASALGQDTFDSAFNIMCLFFKDWERKSLLKNEMLFDSSLREHAKNVLNSKANLHPISLSQLLDFSFSLEGDMLVKVDRTSMQNSLECRNPFLDYRLVQYMMSLPPYYKIRGKQTKVILRDAFSSLLPKGHFNFPKSGFGVPVGNWFRSKLKNCLLNVCDKDILHDQGIFSPENVTLLINQHLKERQDHTFKLWCIYCFQKWHLNSNVKKMDNGKKS